MKLIGSIYEGKATDKQEGFKKTPQCSLRDLKRASLNTERTSAATSARRVRIVEDKALSVETVTEIQFRP
jgi:hypothetical protein